MNAIGIFAKTFVRPTLGEVLDAVVSYDLADVQFNLASAGLPTLPEAVDPVVIDTIRNQIAGRGLRVAALSATFNLIHPDAALRRRNIHRLGALAAIARAIGTNVLTLSSGTCDPDDMWRAHPGNGSAAAWSAMVESIDEALAATEPLGVCLAIEPEPANVVQTAKHAQRLFSEVRSPRLQVLIDGANLLASDPRVNQPRLFQQAFDLLEDRIALVHAKEFVPEGDSGERIPGRGALDWDSFLGCVVRSTYAGPIILHGQPEPATAEAVEFLRQKLRLADGAA